MADYYDPYAIASSASSLLNRPYESSSIFAPAGINDTTKQGWQTALEGLSAQYDPSLAYAQNMGGTANNLNNQYNWLMSGQGYWNAPMQGAYDTAVGAPNQPGFNQAYGLGGLNYSQFGSGWNPQLANQINQVGASFDPYNNPALLDSVQSGVDMLQRQFNQETMPNINAQLGSAGPGAYGGTRAGVAEGIAAQGLTDAQGQLINDMLSQGYAQGLANYVGDRGNTLSTALGAGQIGGELGLGTAQLYGDLANQQGNLGLGSAQIQGELGANQLNAQNNLYGMGLQYLPGLQTQAYNANLTPGQSLTGLGQEMAGYGFAQQQADQNQLDYYNQQNAEMVNWPWQQLMNYNSVMNPYLAPGNVTSNSGTQSAQAPGMSNTQAAIGGAALGYGLYDQFGNQGNNYNAYNPTEGYSYNGWYY